VAAGHRDAGPGLQVVCSEIHHRRRHASDFYHADAGRLDAPGERSGERWAGKPAVVAYRELRAASRAGLGSDRAAYRLDDFRSQGAADDARMS
jgi:hypothetical protein